MRIVFFSDIHANLPALDAFFSDIEKINPDAIYCLGDLVGYNVWANEVVDEIRKRRIPTIMGNHDEALLQPVVEGDRSNKGITRGMLNADNREYLISLPRHLCLDFETNKEAFGVLLVHGSTKAINDYLVEDYPKGEVLEMMEAGNSDLILCGHTHIPYHRIIQSGNEYKHVVNVGSVGKPKDADPRLCYALLTIDEKLSKQNPDSVKVDFRRIEYDIDKAVNAIKESAFPDEFADKLIIAK
ncbi:MAG: metallophosphoesterase family protein [Reichenbachiella sp.]